MANPINTPFKDLDLIFEKDRIYYEVEFDGEIIQTGNVMSVIPSRQWVINKEGTISVEANCCTI